MLENFGLGVHSIFRGISLTVKGVAQFPLFLGFVLGFFVSTCMHIFLITEKPEHISSLLFKNKAESFQKIHPQGEDGTYEVSFSSFIKSVNKIRLFFSVSLFLFMILVMVSLFKF